MTTVSAFISARTRMQKRNATLSKIVPEVFAMKVNQLLALFLLVIMAPLMLAIMIMIWFADGGPVIFAHHRVGRDGKLFRCFKFRSMRNGADRLLAELLRTDLAARNEWEKEQKLTNDPRITPIGKFLRNTSLDELPQLVNVLKGQMFLVGPRPVTMPELSRYGANRWHYISVRPGMTGLWQVSGRNNTSYEERVALDRQYVERRSAFFDAYILLRTIKVVFLRDGAR